MKRLSLILILMSLLLQIVHAEDPVFFADASLKTVVEETLWITDPTPADMLLLTGLWATGTGTGSLVGLEHAVNLVELRVGDNRFISDVSPLATLTQLQWLTANQNRIEDISPLSGLVNLAVLDVHDNRISDISAVSGMTKLDWLSIHENRISDISPLASLGELRRLTLNDNDISDISVLTGFTKLLDLDLRLNPLSEEAYEVHIPQIVSNNPQVDILHDRLLCDVILSSTSGGSTIHPGEGTFEYECGSQVFIEANADPGFVFVKFTGTWNTQENPLLLKVLCNYDIRAVFESVRDVLYVDDDARDDPDPCSAALGDPLEDGTLEHPYDTIQEAIEVAKNGATIRVLAGKYPENITIAGKTVHVIGRDPNDPNGSPLPVIAGGGSGSALLIQGGSDHQSTVSGLAFATGPDQTIVLDCRGGTTIFYNCLIAGNRPTGASSALIQCVKGSVSFDNCTIADNTIEPCDGLIRVTDGVVTIRNSIVHHNACDLADAGALITYSDVEGPLPGLGNIDADPLFVRRGWWTDPQDPLITRHPTDPLSIWRSGDYHLRSSGGRWDAAMSRWLTDEATSPCIDTGNPADPVGLEPAPNGGIVNMGVYGGTTEASKSR